MTEKELTEFLSAPATPCPETQILIDGLIEPKPPKELHEAA